MASRVLQWTPVLRMPCESLLVFVQAHSRQFRLRCPEGRGGEEFDVLGRGPHKSESYTKADRRTLPSGTPPFNVRLSCGAAVIAVGSQPFVVTWEPVRVLKNGAARTAQTFHIVSKASVSNRSRIVLPTHSRRTPFVNTQNDCVGVKRRMYCTHVK